MSTPDATPTQGDQPNTPEAGDVQPAPEGTLYPNSEHPAPDAEPEVKPAEEKQSEGEKKEEAPKEPEDKKDDEGQKDGAPEQYEQFQIPEGLTLDQDLVDKFVPIAKEIGLTQEQAQKIVDLQTAEIQRLEANQQKNWDETLRNWDKQAKVDEEFGGKDFEANLGVAREAMDAFGNEALQDAMDTSGMGNHPEMIRLLFKIGQALKEHNLHKTHTGGGVAKTPVANVLFPNQN